MGVDPATVVDVAFPRRALLVLTGEARYKWSHSICARKHDRVDGKVVRGDAIMLVCVHAY